MMAGLNAGRRQRRRPRGRLGARHPVPGAPAERGRRASRSGSCQDDPQSVVIRFFDADGARHHRGRASARSSGSSTVRTSAGCSPPRSATSASRRGRSSSTPPRSRRTVDVDAIRARRLQGGRRLRLRLDVVRDAQRAGQARAPTCWRSTRTRPPAGVIAFDRRRARRGRRRAGAGVGGAPRRGDRPRRRAPHAHRRRGPRPHRRRGAAGAAHARASSTCWATAVALPVSASRHAERIAAEAGVEDRVDEAVHRRAHGGGLRAGRRLRRQPATAGSSCPASCRPSTPRPRSSRCSSCWPRRVALVEVVAEPPARPRGPRDRRHAVGAEGPGDAHAGRAEQGPRGRCWSTA